MPISSIPKSYLTLSRSSITTSPQGDNLLIIYLGAVAGSGILHSTISCVSRLFPIPQGCQPLGTCSPPEKRAGSHLEVQGCSAPAPRHLCMGKGPICPWDVPPTVSAILVKPGGMPLPVGVG